MRKVAGLAAVAAVLAGYLVFGDRSPGDGGSAGHARLAEAFDRATVRRITISRAGAAPFSLVRQPPDREPAWLESPGDRPADSAAVEDLLDAIDLAETRRTADVAADAAGLTPPRVALELDEPRGPVKLELGRLDAAGQGVFARVGGAATIRVAPRRVAELADRDASAFRDHRLVPLSAEVITAVGWRAPAPAAEGRPEHQLRIVAGRWQNADHQWVAGERVAESLRRLLGVRVERYEPPRPTPQAPSWIAVATTGGAKIQLSIPGDRCAPEAGVRVERDGPSGADGACLAPETLVELWASLKAASVPDRRLVSSPADGVTRVEITEEAGDHPRLVLARQPGGAWRFEAPKVAYAADPRAIAEWLGALRNVEARPAPAVLPPVNVPDRGHVRRLSIDGRTHETSVVARGDPGYGLVDPDPLRFRDHLVLDFAHFDARELRRSAGGRTVELTSADGDAWRVVAPPGAAADRTNAARVVGALGNLRAEAFVPPERGPAGSPELSLSIAIQPPGEPAPIRHTLELFKRKEAPGCTGRLDRDVAFTLAPAACDELRLGLLN
jgi:hypothetical protein